MGHLSSIHQLRVLALYPLLILSATAQSPTPTLNVAEISSVLPPLLSDLPSVLASAGPPLISSFANSIVSANPTAVFSDLPAILASATPGIEDFLNAAFDDAESVAVAAGQLPSPLSSDIPAQVSAFVAAEAGVIIENFDNIATQVPGTVPIQALPSIILGEIGDVETGIPLVLAGEVAGLTSLSVATIATTSTSTPAPGNNFLVSPGVAAPTANVAMNMTPVTPTVSSPSATFMGAANRLALVEAQVLAVVGLVGVIAFL